MTARKRYEKGDPTRAETPIADFSESTAQGSGGVFTTDLYIRSVHPYAYRSGQWGKVLQVRYLPERYGDHPRDARPVYVIQWVDGTTDYWPVYGHNDYEFASEVRT